MKKIRTLAVAIVLVTMALASFSFAQQVDDLHAKETPVFQATFNAEDRVTTVPGDTLWGYSNTEYDRIIAMNPEHKLTKVVYGPGDIRVMLPVGIEIKGVKRVSASSLAVVVAFPSPSPSPSPSASPSPSEAGIFSFLASVYYSLVASFWRWLWLLPIVLLLAVIALLVYIIWFITKRRGAASAGPRFAQHGLTDRTAADEFLRQARANSGTELSQGDFRVENLRRRRGTGAITVAYNNGTSEERYLDNETVYVANLHYPDGSVRRDEMLLSACGNPLRRQYGNVSSYLPGLNFRFTDNDRPFYIPIQSEEAPSRSANHTQERSASPPPQASNQTSVVFDGNRAVVNSGGKTVEIATDDTTTFSNTSEGSLPKVTVVKGGVRLVIENGVITDVGKLRPVSLKPE